MPLRCLVVQGSTAARGPLWKEPGFSIFLRTPTSSLHIGSLLRGKYQNLKHEEAKGCRAPVFSTQFPNLVCKACWEQKLNGRCGAARGRRAPGRSGARSGWGPWCGAPLSWLGLTRGDWAVVQHRSFLGHLHLEWLFGVLSGSEVQMCFADVDLGGRERVAEKTRAPAMWSPH